jgi:hypothetical protein
MYSTWGGGDQLDWQLQTDGLYTVVVFDALLVRTGGYSITLLKMPGEVTSTSDPDGGTITSGDTLSGRIRFPSESDAFQFEGSAGDRVVITAVTTSSSWDTDIRIYPPAGGPVENQTRGYDRLDWQLRTNGIYTILVEDTSLSRVGTYNLNFLKIPGTVSCAADPDGGVIASGQTVGGHLQTAGDLDAFQFYGNKGDRVIINAVTTNGTMDTTMTLYPPTGGTSETSTWAQPMYSTWGGGDQLDWQLQTDGLYTVIVFDALLVRTGGYSISFTKLPPIQRAGIYNPYPPDGASVSNLLDSFSWDAVSGATGYDVFFRENPLDAMRQIGTNLPSPSLPFPQLTNGTTCNWSVVARTNAGSAQGIQGPVWWFTVTGGCAPPTITVPPTSQTVIVGTNVTFGVFARGAPPLVYQWRFNGTPIMGATGTNYLLPTVQTTHDGNYDVVVSNACGVVTSTPLARLTVLIPPSITAMTVEPPSPVVEGTNVTICVTATGTVPLSYQWRRNGTNLPGATTDCYTLINVQIGQAGTYSVAVTNLAGGLVSGDLPLSVLTDWRTNVIGATGDGSYSFDNGIFTVNGSGEDIEGTKDDFFFVHKTLNGDGQIVARMLGLLPADPSSEAGIMFRDGTNSGARHIFLALDSARHVVLRRRLVENDYSVENDARGTNWVWLRLMRLGDTFAGHASTNGVDWSLIWWTTLTMPTNLEVGLAVTAHKNQAMATAQFDLVTPGELTPLSGIWPEVGPRIHLGGEPYSYPPLPQVGGLKMLICGAVGHRYMIVASDDVTTPADAWLSLGTVTNTYGVVTFLDPQALTNPVRFYRLQGLGP